MFDDPLGRFSIFELPGGLSNALANSSKEMKGVISRQAPEANHGAGAGGRLIKRAWDFYSSRYLNLNPGLTLMLRRLVFQGPLVLQKRRRRKVGRPLKPVWWPSLVRLADSGHLTALLNDALPLMPGLSDRAAQLLRRRRIPLFPRDDKYVPVGTGFVLARAFQRSGWKGIQATVLLLRQYSRDPSTDREWDQALLESLVFEQAGFDVGWCFHKAHWFIRDDRRRKDCTRHRVAGWQARFRKKNEQRRRQAEAQKTRATRTSKARILGPLRRQLP